MPTKMIVMEDEKNKKKGFFDRMVENQGKGLVNSLTAVGETLTHTFSNISDGISKGIKSEKTQERVDKTKSNLINIKNNLLGKSDSDSSANDPQISPSRKFCSQCGNELGFDVKFCPACGLKQ